MNKKLAGFSLLLVVLVILPTLLAAQTPDRPVGIFEGESDIGVTLHPGATVYDATAKSYTITAAGENMWLATDAFHFVWKKAAGDIAITSDIRFPKPGGSEHRKAALIFRQDLDADGVYADAALHGSGMTALQYRMEKTTPTRDIEFNIDAPVRLRLEKRGDLFTLYLSNKGEPLHPAGAAIKLHLEGNFYAGLGVCSHNKDVTETAVFANVSIEPLDPPATDKTVLYSTLQSLSIEPDFRRAIVAYAAQGYFEASNWSHDGQSLIFDQGGKIMTVPVDGGTPKALEIGGLTSCTGSHGFSPDGKWLAVSCKPAEGSPLTPAVRVFVVPASGGAPRLVTEHPNSYWHSWSPDGKTILFTRPVDGSLNIWSIPAAGGEEVQVTQGKGISDDPDYSGDGKYIYFNSDRGGAYMQIWRMLADGTKPEQVTFDQRNNWTPHPSPDGKWVVYLSYDKDTKGHPSNKDIKLQLMSAGEGKVSTLVDLVGGNGSFNVPSWAPDSHHLSYVSYELIPDGGGN